jgi:CheY-like chemotaxis protein
MKICDEAVDGQDAVDKARLHRPDLIILDLSMPILNGFEAAAAISEFLPDIPIILFTAFGQYLKTADVTVLGITRVVSKDDPNLVEHAKDILCVA